MCLIFHKWGKWEQYYEHGRVFPGVVFCKNMPAEGTPYTDLRQKRICEKCGKIQDVLVK